MLERIVGAVLWAGIFAVGAGSMAIWTRVVGRWMRGESVVRYEPRRSVPWDTLDIVVVAVIFIASMAAPLAISYWSDVWFGNEQSSAGPTAGAEQSSSDEKGESPAELGLQPDELPMMALVRLLGPLAAVVYVVLRSGATWRDLGFDLSRLPSDVRLGFLTFIAIALPVYALQLILQYFFPGKHQMIRLAESDPEPLVFVWIVVLAVGIAPLTEELLFRVLLQGWLERIELALAPAHPLRRLPHGVLPIFASATCFAALHASGGPDPAPIFVLALALGFVYQRTHRIWASLTIHTALNGTSTVALILQMLLNESA